MYKLNPEMLVGNFVTSRKIKVSKPGLIKLMLPLMLIDEHINMRSVTCQRHMATFSHRIKNH